MGPKKDNRKKTGDKATPPPPPPPPYNHPYFHQHQPANPVHQWPTQPQRQYMTTTTSAAAAAAASWPATIPPLPTLDKDEYLHFAITGHLGRTSLPPKGLSPLDLCGRLETHNIITNRHHNFPHKDFRAYLVPVPPPPSPPQSEHEDETEDEAEDDDDDEDVSSQTKSKSKAKLSCVFCRKKDSTGAKVRVIQHCGGAALCHECIGTMFQGGAGAIWELNKPNA